MVEWKWTPAGDGMIAQDGTEYQKGTEYTGLPYSSTKHVGRVIGRDIFFKTFVSALENPESVLYTEDLRDYGDYDPSNARTYYGIVCSAFTNYCWGSGRAIFSRFHGPYDPGNRDGVVVMKERTATDYDYAVTPPHLGDMIVSTKVGHSMIISRLQYNYDGSLYRVEISESTSLTARTQSYTAANFNVVMNSSNEWGLLRITNPTSWRADNVPGIFPDFDREVPTINSVVLLDRGDWVPYSNEDTTGLPDQPVKFNIMDSDARELIIEQGASEYERIPLSSTGVIERTINATGQYTAKCLMANGSYSQACEFAVCSATLSLESKTIDHTADFDVYFTADNCIPYCIWLRCLDESEERYFHFVTDAERTAQKITIPANSVDYTGDMWVYLQCENVLGRIAAIINDASMT